MGSHNCTCGRVSRYILCSTEGRIPTTRAEGGDRRSINDADGDYLSKIHSAWLLIVGVSFSPALDALVPVSVRGA